MLTRGGRTTERARRMTAPSRIQCRGEGRFPPPSISTHTAKRAPPAGLIEEVKDHMRVELEPVSQALLFILAVRLDKRPIDEQRASHDVGSRHKTPVAPIE